MMDIISRKDAISRGLVRYFTGRPCRNGHLVERLVSGKKCCECNRLGSLKWVKEHPEENRIKSRGYYLKNLEKMRSEGRQSYMRRREVVRLRRAKVADLLNVLKKEMPEMLKEFGL
jgi:hypothetical protein